MGPESPWIVLRAQGRQVAFLDMDPQRDGFDFLEDRALRYPDLIRGAGSGLAGASTGPPILTQGRPCYGFTG